MIKRHQRGLSFVLSFSLFLTAFTGFSVQTAQASPQPASERSAPPSEEELGLEDPIDETGLLEISSLRTRKPEESWGVLLYRFGKQLLGVRI